MNKLMRTSDFNPSFVGWSVEFTKELTSRPGIRFAGADYLSVQPYGGDNLVHTGLLSAGVAILEGLDLADVEPGLYDMVGLSISLPSREAAPARVLLCRVESDSGVMAK